MSAIRSRRERFFEVASIALEGTATERVGADSVASVTVLVDDAIWPFDGRRWAHLVSDVSYDELHEFAERLGIPRRGFQGDHYDIPASYREEALRLGAVPVGSRELLHRVRGAGLRRVRHGRGAVGS
jgi:hypothetical protein